MYYRAKKKKKKKRTHIRVSMRQDGRMFEHIAKNKDG